MNTTDETTWVARAKKGDQAAFEALFQRYESRIYKLICRMIGNADDAYDLTQDCFIKAYLALGRTNKLNFSAWLYTIAYNTCIDVLRRRQRLRFLAWDVSKHDHLLISSRGEDPEVSAISKETCIRVRRVLKHMSPRYRFAIILHEIEGRSLVEIAKILGISIPAMKSTLYRARKEFRVLYKRFE